VFLSDVPGFMIGSAVERQGIIRHGAKMISAMSEATVPKFCVIIRTSYGAGLYAMSGPACDTEATLALPNAMIAVMGPEGAVGIIFRDEIARAADPAAERARRVAEYREKFANPYAAASLGYIDEVIRPRQTRGRLARALDMLANKRQDRPTRKHGNIPL
jgi:propionyl-CoA carboxylase beta chain